MRIVELLEQNNFELSVNYLKYIHKYLFRDVYELQASLEKLTFLNMKKY